MANISTATKLELAACSQQYFNEEWDPEKENPDSNFLESITWALARDDDVTVRQELSEQLSTCDRLPLELAEEIASDIDVVSGPFLARTDAFTDKQMADLVPFLKEHAQSEIAKRPDIKPQTIYAIAVVGSVRSVSLLTVNKFIMLNDKTMRKILERFRDNQYLMDLLAARLDLPLDVVNEIVDLVSSFARQKLVENYAIRGNLVAMAVEVRGVDWICKQVMGANPSQIHSIAIGLRQRGELFHEQVLEVAEAGCFEFLESALALEAEETLSHVREVLQLRDTKAFVTILQKAGVKKNLGARFLKLVKQHNSMNETRRSTEQEPSGAVINMPLKKQI